MSKSINMPQIGQDIETGLIVEWKVKPNDKVAKGDIVAIVESDKATFEVEAFESGIIKELLYKEGEEAKVFSPIAYLAGQGESIQNIPEIPQEQAAAPQVQAESPAVAEEVPTGDKIFAAPLARKLAQRYNIDINTIKGSGPRGRILKQDVMALVNDQADSESSSGDYEIPFSKMRLKIAQRLTLSKQTIPHFYLTVEVDMSSTLNLRREYTDSSSVKITVNDLIVAATARALRKYPKLNAHVESDKMIVRHNIHIGVAVATEEGLLVPVITDTDQKTLPEIALTTQEIIEAARKGVLKPQPGGTFTVSNLGMYAVKGFQPIINPPECGILGVGGIKKQLTVMPGGGFAVRDKLSLTLACDHRAVDGTYAAQFLNELKEKLENISIP